MRKSVKRILALGLSAVLVGSVFAGCTAQNSKYTIGIIQSQQHSALDQATQGFQDAVKKALGEENVEITLQNASGDSATCATIANQFVADGVDLIMANATNALQASMGGNCRYPDRCNFRNGLRNRA